MSREMFSRIVDQKLAEGLPLDRAIEAAAEEDAHHRDPFDVMRDAALGGSK